MLIILKALLKVLLKVLLKMLLLRNCWYHRGVHLGVREMLLYWLYVDSRSRTASYFYFFDSVTFPFMSHQLIHPLLSWHREHGWWIHDSLISTLAVLPLWRESEVWSLRGFNLHSTSFYLLISFLCTHSSTYMLSWLKSINFSRALLGVDFVMASAGLFFLSIH